MLTDANSSTDKLTSENTINIEDDNGEYRVFDANHRNYDQVMEMHISAGKRLPSLFSGVASARRRQDSRLGVSRIPLLEMSGAGREGFYQQRLLLSLSWFCAMPIGHITIDDKETLQWTFQWDPPLPDDIGGAVLESETMTIATSPDKGFSFEELCKQLELKFGNPELGLVCVCCTAGIASSDTCESCKFCTGWHRCSRQGHNSGFFWKPGTLHAGHLDIQRMLFNLHRRRIPTHILEEKAAEYVANEYMSRKDSEGILDVIRAQRGESGIINDGSLDDTGDVHPGLSRRLTREEIEAKLDSHIDMMKSGGEDGVETDQYRVFKFIIDRLDNGEKPLRLMIQASAGTGKSFLLSSIFLWAILKDVKTKACAPTGIQTLLALTFCFLV